MREDELPEIYFGRADSKLPNWRKELDDELDIDDDEELHPTPADVVAMLGFDPLDEKW